MIVDRTRNLVGNDTADVNSFNLPFHHGRRIEGMSENSMHDSFCQILVKPCIGKGLFQRFDLSAFEAKFENTQREINQVAFSEQFNQQMGLFCIGP